MLCSMVCQVALKSGARPSLLGMTLTSSTACMHLEQPPYRFIGKPMARLLTFVIQSIFPPGLTECWFHFMRPRINIRALWSDWRRWLDARTDEWMNERTDERVEWPLGWRYKITTSQMHNCISYTSALWQHLGIRWKSNGTSSQERSISADHVFSHL